MSDKTTIEWTDATWNPTRGCSRVSAGCDHCYAEGIAARFSTIDKRGTRVPPFEGLAKMVHGKPHWTGKIALLEGTLLAPLRWRKPRRIFVNSMSDLFHEGVPDAFIDRVFAVMALCRQHTFQVLTKRPERMRAYCTAMADGKVRGERLGTCAGMFDDESAGDLTCDYLSANTPWPFPNVWKGVSVENQEAADLRIPLLLQTPAAVRFISAEPLLGALELRQWHGMEIYGHTGKPCCTIKQGYHRFESKTLKPGGSWVNEGDVVTTPRKSQIDWVICGGESGPGARPMHPDWARSLRDQCQAAGVPFFFKQWGESRIACADCGLILENERDDCPKCHSECANMYCVGKKRAGRLLDGREWSQFPEAAP